MSLYDTLGVPKDASPAEIKAAMRKKAHAAHPDKGGNPETFHQIIRAAKILGDAESRQRYDETGSEDETPDERQVALATLAGFFMQALETQDPDTTDLINSVRKQVKQGMANWQADAQKQRSIIRKLEKGLKRVKRKNPGDNFFLQCIENTIQKRQAATKVAEANEAAGKLMIEILDDYVYEVDERKGNYAPLQSFLGGYP